MEKSYYCPLALFLFFLAITRRYDMRTIKDYQRLPKQLHFLTVPRLLQMFR